MYPCHINVQIHLVCAIPSLEIDRCCPVVRQVLVELAAGTAGNLGDVGHGHRGIEGVLGESRVNTDTAVRGDG